MDDSTLLLLKALVVTLNVQAFTHPADAMCYFHARFSIYSFVICFRTNGDVTLILTLHNPTSLSRGFCVTHLT